MINGFEYRDHSPKCPERSDKWLNPDEWTDERDDEWQDAPGEPGEPQEPSDDEIAYQEFLDEFGKK